MTLPNLFGQLRHVNGPEVDLVAAGRSKLTIVLPCYVHDLTLLLKAVHCFFLDTWRVPYQNSCFIPSRGNECVCFVPAWADERILRPEQAFKLTLHAPYSGYVVVCTGKQSLTVLTPLDTRDVVAVILPVWHFVIISKTNVPQLHCWFCRELVSTEIPDVNKAVSSSSCC